MKFPNKKLTNQLFNDFQGKTNICQKDFSVNQLRNKIRQHWSLITRTSF